MLNVNDDHKYSRDVKDRSVLKVVHLINNTNVKVSIKEIETDDGNMYVPFTSRPGLASEITYQRLSRLGRVPSATLKNDSSEEKSTASTPDNPPTILNHCSSRSLSEPRRRITHQTPANSHLTGQSMTFFSKLIYANLLATKEVISSPRSGSTTPTTPRFADDDAR